MNKMWRSEGEEQKFLENLLYERKINTSMKPSEVQKGYPIFMGFAPATFRKHWNKTKQMFDNKVLNYRGELDGDDFAEVDGAGSPQKIPKVGENNTEESKTAQVCFKRPPVITSTFRDPDTRETKCLVIIYLFSNVKTIEFDIVTHAENSQLLKVTYAWPRSAFVVSEIFKRDGSNNTFINKLHPMYESTEKALEELRENFEDAPVGSIEIKLPTLVQSEPSTWKKYFNKKADGSLLVYLELICHRGDYIISKAEKSLSLE